MNFSKYQTQVFNSLKEEQGNIIVEALAGSGKTFTIVEATKQLPNSRILLLAFNTSIKKELELKAGSNCDVLTTHSYGMRCISGRKFTNKWRQNKIYQDILGIDKFRQKNRKEDNEKFDILMKLSSFLQSACLHPDQVTAKAILSIADFYAIDINGFDVDDLTNILVRGLREILSNTGNIDFDGMIYIPAVNGWTNKEKYDFVFIDEAQDLNPAQIALISAIKNSNPNTRFVFVGDPNQAIYGFRGAGTDTFPIIKSEFQAESLPLSICYRCSKSVIRDAQRFVSGIEYSDNAIEGEVVPETFIDDLMDEIKDNFKDSIVLSRKNAPNVSLCYRLLKNKIPAIIVGRDVADNLIKTIKKLAGDTMEIKEFSKRLQSYVANKVDNLMDRGMESLAQSFYDMEEIFNEIITKPNEKGEYCQTSADVEKEIGKLFAKDDKGDYIAIKLMSIHKSKGLEAEFVYINSDFSFPCKTPEQKQQEINLKYVAATRAKVKTTYFDLKGEENE